MGSLCLPVAISVAVSMQGASGIDLIEDLYILTPGLTSAESSAVEMFKSCSLSHTSRTSIVNIAKTLPLLYEKTQIQDVM